MLQASSQFVTRARSLALDRWLIAVAALIVAMVVIGGITRLTESGLSITRVASDQRHRPAAHAMRSGRPSSRTTARIPQYRAP